MNDNVALINPDNINGITQAAYFAGNLENNDFFVCCTLFASILIKPISLRVVLDFS